MPFGIGHPPTYTSVAVYMCGGGLKGPKSSNGIQLSQFVQSYGIFSDFVVPTWSPSSSHCPHHPHIVLTSSPSSPSSSCCPHSPQKVPMWSPWSVVSTCCPRCPHIIPTSSPHHPHRPRHPHVVPIAPRRSPCGLHSLWSPHVVPVVPIIPTSSLLSPHYLEGPHIIPNPPDTHSTHPHPPGGWGPRISKNAIRFELIKIF